ncbi:MAG: hypothetical protein L0215_11570 [Gemmataceae bacterium]|nr:hypothetical protein [Gemmataceae bacterium]
MSCRIASISLLAGMVLATPGVAQETSPKKSTEAVERRLDELEKQLEQMLRAVKAPKK